MDKLRTAHEADAPDITDDRVLFLQFDQAVVELLTTGLRILHEMVFFDVFEYGQAGC